jgi:hypothetical protein
VPCEIPTPRRKHWKATFAPTPGCRRSRRLTINRRLRDTRCAVGSICVSDRPRSAFEFSRESPGSAHSTRLFLCGLWPWDQSRLEPASTGSAPLECSLSECRTARCTPKVRRNSIDPFTRPAGTLSPALGQGSSVQCLF